MTGCTNAKTGKYMNEILPNVAISIFKMIHFHSCSQSNSFQSNSMKFGFFFDGSGMTQSSCHVTGIAGYFMSNKHCFTEKYNVLLLASGGNAFRYCRVLHIISSVERQKGLTTSHLQTQLEPFPFNWRCLL